MSIRIGSDQLVERRRNWGRATSADSPLTLFAVFAATTRTVVPDPAGSGADVIEIVTTGASGGLTQSVVTGSIGAAENMPAGVVTAVARVRGPAGQAMRIGIQEYSPTIALRGETWAAFVATGDWQDVYAQRTLVASDSRTRVTVQKTTAGTFHVWAFSIEVGEPFPPGIILPGYPSPDPALVPAWSGTPYESEPLLMGFMYTTPDLVLGWEMQSTARSIVQDIIGGGVAISSLRSRPRTGTLRLFYMTEDAAVEAFLMHAPAATFSVGDLDNPGSWREMLYVVADGGCRIALDEVTRRRWIVEVEYQELQPS